MFFKNFFGKKELKAMDFSSLNSYENRQKYFVRKKPWDWLNKKEIYVVSKLNDKPTLITMDFWAQEVYLNADGQITVTELFSIAGQQYIDCDMDVPENLGLILIDSLEELTIKLGIMELVDQKTDLTNDLLLPISKHEQNYRFGKSSTFVSKPDKVEILFLNWI